MYIDDIFLLSNHKLHMLELIEELHKTSTKNNIKPAPEKSIYMLQKVKFLGHEIGNNTIKPIHSKIEAIKTSHLQEQNKLLCNFLEL